MAGRVKVVMDGDDRKLVRALGNATRAEEKLGRAAKKAGQRAAEGAKAASTQGDKAFGMNAVTQIGRYAAGLVGVAAVANAVKSALEGAVEAQRRLGEQQRADAPGFAKLAQVADSPQHLQQLISQSMALAERGGFDSLKSSGIIFQLQSGLVNTAENRGLVGSLGDVVGDPVGLIRAAGQVRNTFGADEAGSVNDIISKGLRASKATSSTVDELLAGVSSIGGIAKKLGLSDEATFSAVTAASQGTSASIGATRIKALLQALSKKDPQSREILGAGGSLDDVVASLETRGLTEISSFQKNISARGEAFLGLGAIQDAASTSLGKTVTAFEGDLETAATTNLAARTAELAESNPTVFGAKSLAQSEARQARVGTDAGRRDSLLRTIRSNAINRTTESGSFVQQQIEGFGASAARFMGLDENVVDLGMQRGDITAEQMEAIAPGQFEGVKRFRSGGGGMGGMALGLGIAPSIMQAFSASQQQAVGGEFNGRTGRRVTPGIAGIQFTPAGVGPDPELARRFGGGGKFNGRGGGIASIREGGPVQAFETAEDALAAVRADFASRANPQGRATRGELSGLGKDVSAADILRDAGGPVLNTHNADFFAGPNVYGGGVGRSADDVRGALREGMGSLGRSSEGQAILDGIRESTREQTEDLKPNTLGTRPGD